MIVELVSGLSDDKADANAFRIAAATVLLEACRHARQKGYLAPQPGTPEAQAPLDAAIAKAST